MQVTNKIKAILSMRGLRFSDYARKLNIKPQSLNTKAKASAYKIDDLIQLADLTDTTLAFNDRETGKPLIEFDSTDIEERKNG